MTNPPEHLLDLRALEADPFPIWAQLRAEAPVAWVPSLHANFVTRWDDVVRVARDAETFSAEVHASPLSRTLGPNLLHADDPNHARQRAPLTTHLRHTRVLSDLGPVIDQILDGLLASLAVRREVDLVSDIADPLAHQVLSAVIGLPHVSGSTMRRWVQGIGAGAANFERDPAVDAAARAVCDEVDEALREALAQGPASGSMLDALKDAPFQQVSSTAKLLIIGGLQEPRDLLGLAALGYLRDDAVRGLVDTAPGDMSPRLVEEALRWGSPVGTITRITTRPAVLSGITLPAGAVVAGVLASANHDERQWTQPEVFDIQRDDLHHLAFAAGVHTCAGAGLARLQVLRALERLLPLGLELAAEPEVRGWEFRGPVALQVTLGQRRRTPMSAPFKGAATVEVTVHDARIDAGALLLELEGDNLPAWTPGAHIDLLLENGLCRQYSLCGDPTSRRWQIAVRRAPDSRGGSAWLHEHARPGLRLRARGPRNHFAPTDGPAIFIAGGIGITPLLPMLADRSQPWQLHYLTRGAAPFSRRLQAYGDNVTLYDTTRHKRPDVASLLAAADPGTAVYCCGPEGLVAAVERHAPPDVTVRSERFTSARKTLDGPESGFVLALAREGTQIAVASNETALTALERSGVFVPSSCREGICGSCEVTLLTGEADHRSAVTSPGCFLPCVSRALRGELVLDL